MTTKNTVREDRTGLGLYNYFEVGKGWIYTSDPKSKVEYIQVGRGIVSKTQELRDGLIIDTDANGNVLGVEILTEALSVIEGLKAQSKGGVE